MENITCSNCKHYLGELTCVAFPDGIPDKFITGNEKHTKKEPGPKSWFFDAF